MAVHERYYVPEIEKVVTTKLSLPMEIVKNNGLKLSFNNKGCIISGILIIIVLLMLIYKKEE